MKKLCLALGILFLFAACKAQKTNVTKEIKPSNTNNIPLVNYKEIGAPLPEFKVVRLDGTKIVRKDAQYDGNLFIMFFNPIPSNFDISFSRNGFNKLNRVLSSFNCLYIVLILFVI